MNEVFNKDTLESENAPSGKVFLRLLGLVAPFRSHLISSFFIMTAVVAAKLVVPRQMGVAIDHTQTGDFDKIPGDVIVILLAGVVMSILNFSRRVVSGKISLGVEQSLRQNMFEHLSTRSWRFWNQWPTGQLISRSTYDVTSVRFFLGYSLVYFFMHFLTILTVPAMLIYIDWRMAIVVLISMPLLSIVSWKFNGKVIPLQQEIAALNAANTNIAEENIVGARVVRSFGQEDAEIEKYSESVGRIVEAETLRTRINSYWLPLYGFIPNATLAAVVALAAWRITGGGMTIGAFFAFYGYMLQLENPLRIFGSLLVRAQRSIACGRRIFTILDSDDELPVADPPVSIVKEKSGATIDFEGVSYSYSGPDAPEGASPTLANINLHVDAGETIAIVGPTGSGKTTLASLIPRLHDVDEGTVRINGVDVRDADLTELRRIVGIVDQDPLLFSLSVRGNLRFGNPEATDEDLRNALEKAHALEFVDALPEGLDTLIGERGVTLSGGQRQRLAIARALLSNPSVLILDDATSSLDVTVESQITGSLSEPGGSQTTTIIIAHRPSTIALASRVAVMESGQIVDVGPAAEVRQRNGFLANLLEHQGKTWGRQEFIFEGHEGADGQAGMPL